MRLTMVIGNGKADALGGVNDGRVHADHQPLRIEQRAAAVARVEGGVGLDHVVDQVPGDAAQGAAQRADDAGGDGGIETEGAADGHDQLADPQAGRFAELGVGEPGVFGLDDGDVGPGVGPDDVAIDFAAVVQANTQPARAADDVVIGEEKSVGSDQKAGARSAISPASRRPRRRGDSPRPGRASRRR